MRRFLLLVGCAFVGRAQAQLLPYPPLAPRLVAVAPGPIGRPPARLAGIPDSARTARVLWLVDGQAMPLGQMRRYISGWHVRRVRVLQPRRAAARYGPQAAAGAVRLRTGPARSRPPAGPPRGIR